MSEEKNNPFPKVSALKNLLWLILAPLLLLAGCRSAENNHLLPEDFASYLKRANLKVDNVRPVLPDPFRATSAVAILIDGSEIGVYKYDRNARVQADRIRRLEETGCTYINGVPYPVAVRGSFMLFGLDKSPKKKEILEVFNRFD